MPINIPPSRPGLRNLFNTLGSDITGFYSEFNDLVDSTLPLHVLLAYVFFRLEQGQLLALYLGSRKLQRTDSELTWKALDSQRIDRETFLTYFETIYSFPIPQPIREIIVPAEKIRDRLMHGKIVTDPNLREAIARPLYYSLEINNLIAQKINGLRPFVSDLRGVIGRLESLDKPTSRWILKGMGFQLS